MSKKELGWTANRKGVPTLAVRIPKDNDPGKYELLVSLVPNTFFHRFLAIFFINLANQRFYADCEHAGIVAFRPEPIVASAASLL